MQNKSADKGNVEPAVNECRDADADDEVKDEGKGEVEEGNVEPAVHDCRGEDADDEVKDEDADDEVKDKDKGEGATKGGDAGDSGTEVSSSLSLSPLFVAPSPLSLSLYRSSSLCLSHNFNK